MTLASKGERGLLDCIFDGSRFGDDILGAFDSGGDRFTPKFLVETRVGGLLPIMVCPFPYYSA